MALESPQESQDSKPKKPNKLRKIARDVGLMAAGAVAMEAGHTIRDVYDRHQEEKRQEQGVEAVNGESEASKYANDWFEKYYHLKEYNTSERGNQLVQEFLQHFQDLSEGLAKDQITDLTKKYTHWDLVSINKVLYSIIGNPGNTTITGELIIFNNNIMRYLGATNKPMFPQHLEK